MRRVTFVVEMGQAFYRDLPALLERNGARVLDVDRGDVDVRVTASFPAGTTADAVQDVVWGTWSTCAVGVREAGR
jgi:hypothetical protein